MLAKITPLPLESRVTANLHCAFITAIARGVRPFINAPLGAIPEGIREIECDAFLMQVRSEGGIGFFGGGQGPGESPKDAAIREADEEADYAPDPENVEAICSHLIEESHETRCAHLYAEEVHPQRLPEIFMRTADRVKQDWESNGVIIAPALCIPNTNYCLPNIMASQMPVGTDEQMFSLFRRFNSITPHEEAYLRRIAAGRQVVPPYDVSPDDMSPKLRHALSY